MRKIKFDTKIFLILIILFASALRLYKVTVNPPSLFGDELEVGYQAYSILKTGRDYYGNFMPIEFHSLAEWRTPLYLYSCVPTVALFGVTPLGVRLPAVVFGVLGVYFLYLFLRELLDDEQVALLGSFMLAISPWHLQYSRAGFEVTELLAVLLLALYFFLRGVKKQSKEIVASAFLFGLLPWIYNTAKLFTPLFILLLVITYYKKLKKISKKQLLMSFFALVIIAGPIAFNTIFGGGAERFNYLSIFSDDKVELTVGESRSYDLLSRSGQFSPLTPQLTDKLFHNKFSYAGSVISDNYLKSLSTDFLFSSGDPNLRHSTPGMGEFYKVEIIALLMGLVVLFAYKREQKLILFGWIIIGILPAALTRDGGTHATRLILVLPPLIALISLGVNAISKTKYKKIVLGGYFLVLAFMFVDYLHYYYVHYPYQSERWWHAGYEESIDYIRQNQNKYERVVLSTASEPPWVFFAAWMEYPPEEWQNNFPLNNKVNLLGFGKVSYIGKYYFGSIDAQNIYGWGKVLDDKTLYLASSEEVKLDLLNEPERTPGDIKLLRTVTYPSGKPAFYLFTGTHEI